MRTIIITCISCVTITFKPNMQLVPHPFKSIHQRWYVEKGVLKHFAKFTGKQQCQSLYFDKVARLSLATLSKKKLWHRCFPVNFVKYLKPHFYRKPLDDCFCPLSVVAVLMQSWMSYKNGWFHPCSEKNTSKGVFKTLSNIYVRAFIAKDMQIRVPNMLLGFSYLF